MSDYQNASLKKYSDDLAAKLPAPGGGSAAALAAACGISLVSMVVNFTLGKPKYAQYENRLKEILGESEKLREDFLGLVDLDVMAYQSKDIKKALDIPLTTARLSFAGIKLCPELITKGNINLISDVAVAAIFLEAAFRAAYFNVEINLKLLADKKLSSAVRKELATQNKLVQKIRQKTEAQVGKIIGR